MKLRKLLKIASAAYPDHAIIRAADNEEVGDGLAKFIASELSETFEPDSTDWNQLEYAIKLMRTAESEIGEVLEALDKARSRLLKPKTKRRANE